MRHNAGFFAGTRSVEESKTDAPVIEAVCRIFQQIPHVGQACASAMTRTLEKLPGHQLHRALWKRLGMTVATSGRSKIFAEIIPMRGIFETWVFVGGDAFSTSSSPLPIIDLLPNTAKYETGNLAGEFVSSRFDRTLHVCRECFSSTVVNLMVGSGSRSCVGRPQVTRSRCLLKIATSSKNVL